MAFFIFSTIFLMVSIYLNLHTLKRKNEILKTLNWFNEGLEHIYDIEELSKYVVNFFSNLTASSKGALFLYSHQNHQLRLSASRGLNHAENFPPLSTGSHVSSWASQTSPGMLSLRQMDSPLFDEIFSNFRSKLQNEGFTHLLPLIERHLLLGFVALGGPAQPIPKDLLEPLLNTGGHALESLYLYESAVTDETTNLFNKRFFHQSLQAELRRSERYKQPFSLIAFDIDDFKKINDNYGHPQGDKVLSELAECVRRCIRADIDMASRTGGEEFHIILPETNTDNALQAAERLRAEVRSTSFSGFPQKKSVTISLGVATYPKDATQEEDLIAITDKALYLAKSRGKDQSCKAEELNVKNPSPGTGHSRQLTLLDTTTTLYRSDYLSLKLKEELKRSARYKLVCSILLLGFPKSESEWQSETFRKFSLELRNSLRIGIDIPSALDRTHIAILLPETDGENALATGERLQALVQNVSVNIGIASFPKDALTHEGLMTAAFLSLEALQNSDPHISRNSLAHT